MKSKTILFPITYKCNLDCQFCCVKNQRKINVDIDKSLKSIKKFKEVEWVYITGGEPFLIENLIDVCLDLKESGFKVGITTNGTILKEDIHKYVDRIGVSLDGDEEYHDTYRGKGVFSKAISLLESIKGKCETVVMSTAFRENKRALERLKPIIEEINPTYWQIQRDINDPSLVISKEL